MVNPFMVGLLVQCDRSGRSDVMPEGLLVTGIKLKAFVNCPRAFCPTGAVGIETLILHGDSKVAAIIVLIDFESYVAVD